MENKTVVVKDYRFQTAWLAQDIDFDEFPEEPITVIGYLKDAINDTILKDYGDDCDWNYEEGTISVKNENCVSDLKNNWNFIVNEAWEKICGK